MQKLTPFGRLIIVLLVLGAGFGIFKVLQNQGIIPENFMKPAHTETTTTDNTKDEPATPENKKDNNEPQEPEPVTETTPTFSYTPPLPQNGKLKGVVELGATGFNSFIITIDAQKHWKLEKSEFGNSLVMENMATEDDIRAGLKSYIGTMLDYGVLPKDIHFVVSSGAAKSEVTTKITNALKTLKYFVNVVTPEQEGGLALKCVLPEEYENNAFVVDIGSGNTKISWKENGEVKALETYGSKYYQNSTDDNTVYEAARAKARQILQSHTKTCFIIGGSPFKMAKEVRNGKERYTTLKSPSDYKFTDAKDKAGLNIYKGIANGSNCNQFVFDWDANFTIGFLLTLP
jgi:hypothetical protein